MVLAIEKLSVSLRNNDQKIVDAIDLNIEPGQIVGLVGGSGSGKTTTGLSILRLLPDSMHISSGRIIFNGKDLLTYSPGQMRSIRGSQISMIFQDPLNAFNPVFTIGYQIDEVLKFHVDIAASKRTRRTLELLGMVGISDPPRVYRSYPHQLSGGMRQRAMIAQAIAAEPKMVIADEPTSNLDVTIQAKIINIFEDLRSQLGLSFLLITHDLGLVEYLADHIYIMRQGKIVESGQPKSILHAPQHTYTLELINAIKG